MGSIPALRRRPGEGNGNLLLYYLLGNPMDRGACGHKRVKHNLASKTIPSFINTILFYLPLNLKYIKLSI